MSMLKTRSSNRAQLMRCGRAWTVSTSRQTVGTASVAGSCCSGGTFGTTNARSLAFGASTPWNRMRCSRGRGTDRQLLRHVREQRVGEPAIALGVLEVDRVDLVRHRRRADLARHQLPRSPASLLSAEGSAEATLRDVTLAKPKRLRPPQDRHMSTPRAFETTMPRPAAAVAAVRGGGSGAGRGGLHRRARDGRWSGSDGGDRRHVDRCARRGGDAVAGAAPRPAWD